MYAITTPSFRTYQNDMPHSSIQVSVRQIVRNWIIQQRISRLENKARTRVNWDSLTEQEKAHQVHVISATRHAILRMRKLMNK